MCVYIVTYGGGDKQLESQELSFITMMRENVVELLIILTISRSFLGILNLCHLHGESRGCHTLIHLALETIIVYRHQVQVPSSDRTGTLPSIQTIWV